MSKIKSLRSLTVNNTQKSNVRIKTVTAIGGCFDHCHDACKKELSRFKRDTSTFHVVNVSNEWEWQASENDWGGMPTIGRGHPFGSRVLSEGEKVLSITRVRFKTGITPHLFHVDHHGLPVSRPLVSQFKDRMPKTGGFFMSASNIYMEQLTAFFSRFSNMFPGSPYVLSAAYVPETTVFSGNIEVSNKSGSNGIVGALVVPKKSSEASDKALTLDLMKLLSETSDFHSGCLANGNEDWLEQFFQGKRDASTMVLVPGMLPVLSFSLYVWPGTYAYWSVGNASLTQLLQTCHEHNKHFVTVPVRTKAVGKVIGTECAVKSISFKKDPSSGNQIPMASVALYGVRRVVVDMTTADKNGIYHSISPYRDTSVGSQDHVNHLIKEATHLMQSLRIVQSPTTKDTSNVSFTLVGDCARYGYLHSSVHSTLFHLTSATSRLEALCLLLEDRQRDAQQQQQNASHM